MTLSTTFPSSSAVNTDADLLVRASNKEDVAASRAAFNAFWKIYGPYVCSYVPTYCRKHANWQSISDEVISATMIKAFTYSHSFETLGIEDPAKVSRNIKAWLATIARMEYLNIVMGEKADQKQLDEYLSLVARNKPGAVRESPYKKILDDALNTLTDRNREIYLAYLEAYEPGKKLTKECAKRMADMFQITDLNRRQIVKRSREKIQKYLTDNNIPHSFYSHDTAN